MEDSVTSEEQQRLQDAFRDFDQTVPSDKMSDLKPASRSQFCEEWPGAKRVLQFLIELPMLPGFVKDAIRIVIRAGDMAEDILC